MPTGRTAFVPLPPAPLRLDGFEGPFELLLHLLDAGTLEITAVSLAEVTEQYLTYLRLLPPAATRLDFLAEFLVVASGLLVLKSRALLPREAARPIEPEALDEATLEARLAEYRRFRAAAADLRSRQERGERAFARQAPPPLPPAPAPHLEAAEPLHLARALQRLLARREALSPAGVQPAPPRVTLAERIAEVRGVLETAGRAGFSWLAERCESRADLVITFLAILELYRRHEVVLEQDTVFGEIWIARG